MAYTVKEILKMQVAPALGCTEPVAIALGAAAAASLLRGDAGDTIDSIEIWVDPNIYKNGLAVSIPGTDGLSGLDTAAALGALGAIPPDAWKSSSPSTPIPLPGPDHFWPRAG